MTTKKVKPVAEKTAIVVKKATPKKPTLKQLQDQLTAATLTIDNLGNLLDAKNILIGTLEADVLHAKEDNKALEREVVMLNASIRHRDEIILRLEVPFYRKIFYLFGN